MRDPLARLPETPSIFDGTPVERYVALSLEALVHDVSLSGDRDTAMALGGYIEGEEQPPAGVPAFVEVHDGRITLSNPPFLLAEITLDENDEYVLAAAFDSDLDLLVDPPVEVTYRGDLATVVSGIEQTIATIYRTRGRHLEKIHEGVVER